MIVVDASALVAIADREPDASLYLRAIAVAKQATICDVNAAEAGFVLLGRGRFDGAQAFMTWRRSLRIDVSTAGLMEDEVLEAFLRFGKGRHRARLNLGDCFAYALAKRLDAPLLYKGEDFAFTDVRSAL
ncbi:MAG: type II toxin-antitoxin system VapC family toxin [Phenylobacterium sp.]|nr:type II toxin-antitoxin system VapC family toxin [Phenylobacterium sp.]